jgi:peptidoglycan/LPS O-acetylase OafA/YrhL
LRERFSKLAVPLVAGCVLLVPGIKYLELRSGLDLNHGGLRVSEPLQESFRSVIPDGLPLAEPFDESFFEFLPSFFTQLDRFSWSHLWFLAYLLTLTLVLLPAFAWLLRRKAYASDVSRLWVYAPVVPLATIQLTLAERFPGPYNLYNDWAHLAFFATFLLSGFLLAVRPELEGAIRSEWRRALGVALVAMAVLLAAVLGLVRSSSVMLAGTAVAGWCFVVALLGFARERVIRPHPALGYLADSAFPIYLLHQPVIVLLGYWVVGLSLGIAAKFVLLSVSATLVTLAIYHFAVRPFALTRFLAGMKIPRRGARRESGSAPQAAPALGRP